LNDLNEEQKEIVGIVEGIRESAKPKRKLSKNWVEITRNILRPHEVFDYVIAELKNFILDNGCIYFKYKIAHPKLKKERKSS